eukprot:TRINITY_DN8030_c0_g6_i2.p1 TRINITY_DN8030_c0_g6~~TRINITY_DN8030_c0_g6_i2.p1  ORF type:complete len:106 (+),score=22.00 TRINITY_DN8030_c0_g6_i2:315-632(+)
MPCNAPVSMTLSSFPVLCFLIHDGPVQSQIREGCFRVAPSLPTPIRLPNLRKKKREREKKKQRDEGESPASFTIASIVITFSKQASSPSVIFNDLSIFNKLCLLR